MAVGRWPITARIPLAQRDSVVKTVQSSPGVLHDRVDRLRIGVLAFEALSRVRERCARRTDAHRRDSNSQTSPDLDLATKFTLLTADAFVGRSFCHQ